MPQTRDRLCTFDQCADLYIREDEIDVDILFERRRENGKEEKERDLCVLKLEKGKKSEKSQNPSFFMKEDNSTVRLKIILFTCDVSFTKTEVKRFSFNVFHFCLQAKIFKEKKRH